MSTRLHAAQQVIKDLTIAQEYLHAAGDMIGEVLKSEAVKYAHLPWSLTGSTRAELHEMLHDCKYTLTGPARVELQTTIDHFHKVVNFEKGEAPKARKETVRIARVVYGLEDMNSDDERAVEKRKRERKIREAGEKRNKERQELESVGLERQALMDQAKKAKKAEKAKLVEMADQLKKDKKKKKQQEQKAKEAAALGKVVEAIEALVAPAKKENEKQENEKQEQEELETGMTDVQL